MSDATYANDYRNIDFRKHPERYPIGRGEQGVLIAEPYKSELLPHWKFATPELAKQSAQKISSMFDTYKANGDFVGMDMARKYLQMGFTRSRRYANHHSGNKYADDGTIHQQDTGSEQSAKAKSAAIFKAAYDRVRSDVTYMRMRDEHKKEAAKAASN